MSKLSELVTEFRELESRFSHPPLGGGRRGDFKQRRSNFIRAQTELFQLAQTICFLTSPEIQMEIDNLRRQVMQELKSPEEMVTITPKYQTSYAVMKLTRHRRPIRWPEYLITPEIDADLALTGRKVTKELAIRLQKTHLTQIKCIRGVCGV